MVIIGSPRVAASALGLAHDRVRLAGVLRLHVVAPGALARAAGHALARGLAHAAVTASLQTPLRAPSVDL